MGQWYDWHTKGQVYDKKNIIPIERTLIMRAVFLLSLMDSQRYQDIFRKNMMQNVDKLNRGDHWPFQQDNHPGHTSRSTRKKYPATSYSGAVLRDLKEAIAAMKLLNITEKGQRFPSRGVRSLSPSNNNIF
ncbi:hypothetical protein CHARACLAT_010295 [Characodon lateralis]|uniref:Uncharacterized protein n=1 Tax=Characodon lateralis TaxID=208331 RepID=A0ABU7CQK7_9TELE|nr:hypothetical protein [Characodon lateralis]